MARMRAAKQEIRNCLCAEDWRERMRGIEPMGVTAIGPLFSFLLSGPTIRHRAAVGLGRICSILAEQQPEAARNVVRRYMWHLSEESGNIGWGIPEAFAETLVASPLLKKEFHRILITYVIDLGREDNYCDNDQLRRSCFWACGRFAGENRDLCAGWRVWLVKGLQDPDVLCRGMACWALSRLPLTLMDIPPVRALAQEGHEAVCELFDGDRVCERSVTDIALDTLRQVGTGAGGPA